MLIAQNKKAFHDYFIESKLEAGMVLQGWETKAIRSGRAQIKESYVIVRDNEIWIIGAHISPLITTSTHVKADPTRTRKLLLHRSEINKLIGHVERKGYSIIPLALHLTPRGFIKCEIGLAKGKKKYDKREQEKQKDWQREKLRILHSQNKRG